MGRVQKDNLMIWRSKYFDIIYHASTMMFFFSFLRGSIGGNHPTRDLTLMVMIPSKYFFNDLTSFDKTIITRTLEINNKNLLKTIL
jgi:hypothetical protein